MDRQNTTSRKLENLDEYITTPIAMNTEHFRFFGKIYNKVKLSSNGFLTFGPGDYTKSKGAFAEYAAQDAAIFLDHADLDMRGSALWYNKLFYRQSLNPPTTAQRTELVSIRSLIRSRFYAHSTFSTFDPDWFWVTSMDGVGYYPSKVDRLNFVQVILTVDSVRNMTFVIYNTRFEGVTHPVTDPVIGLVSPTNATGTTPYVDIMKLADSTNRAAIQFAQQSNVRMPGVYIYPVHNQIVNAAVTFADVCFGLQASDSSVCSGHGKCVGQDICECSQGYRGSECNIACITDKSQWQGNYCQVPVCYGVPAYDKTRVCSGHGTCSAPNQCTCSSSYSGDDCSFFQCFGILKNETNVCSDHGTCTGVDTCVCKSGYAHGGTNECQNTVCVDGCANGGSCTGPNECSSCISPFFGNTCKEAYRYVSQTTGDDQGGANNCLNRNSPCRTIVHAISMSDHRNVITLMGGGTYELPLFTILIERSLIFKGESASTILESNADHNPNIPHFGVLHQISAHEVEFHDVTLRNIRADSFLVVRCTHGSKAVFANVVAEGNSVKRVVHYTGTARLEIHNSTFSDFSVSPIYVGASQLHDGDYVTMKNTAFTNMRTSSNVLGTVVQGSVIHAQNIATITLSNVTVAHYSNLTSVYLENAKEITLSSCTFSNGEFALSGDSPTALFVAKSTKVTISSMLITDNIGGKSIVRMDNVGTLQMTSAQFTRNTASTGTAGFSLNSVSAYTVTGGVFNHNRGLLGGAVNLLSSHGTFATCSFLNNTASEASCIYLKDSSVTVSSCTFFRNLALKEIEFLSGLGAVISASGTSFVGTESSEFAWNHGCITVKDSSYYSLTDTVFHGHIYGTIQALSSTSDKLSTISGCTFSDNQNSNGFGGSVTSFAFKGAGLKITGSNFTVGTAYNGGAIASVEQSTLIIENTTFSQFSATSSGGALYLEQVNDTTLHNVAIEQNKAEFGGGLFAKEVLKTRFFVRMGGLHVSNANFTNNTATGDGGAVTLSTENIFVCDKCIFQSNRASKSGGAIHADGVAYQSALEDGQTFESVVASSTFGELLTVEEAPGLVLQDSVFDQNSADIGGSITTFSNGIRLKLQRTNITRSSATSDGGAVYVFVRRSEILNSHISASSAMRGGCVYTLLSVESLLFSHSEFSACTADEAAIFLSTDTLLYFTNSILRESVTVSGGIISSANMFVENSYFYDNRATDYGPAIAMLNSGALNLTNSVFMRNYAGNKGGAIYSSSYDQLTFNSVHSEGNTAALGGTVFFDIPVNSQIDAPIVRAVSIDNSSYIADSATIAGGIFFSHKRGHMAWDTTLSNVNGNTSASGYGKIFASEPSTISTSYIETMVNPLTDELTRDVLYTFNRSQVYVVFSGQYFDAVFEILDHYKQIVSKYPDLTVKATANGAQLIGASLEELITDSKITFKQLQMYGNYDTTATITFAASGVSDIPPVTFGVKFVSCPRGYRYVPAIKNDDAVDKCELCPRGSYTLRPFQTDCVYNCPNFECEASTINAQRGFWVDVGADGQIRAVPCPNGKCIGGELEMYSDDQPNIGSAPIPSGFSTFSAEKISLGGDAGLFPFTHMSLNAEDLILSDANFSSLIPNSLREVTSFSGSSCEDNRVGILCAQCLPNFAEWRGSCLRCESASALLTLALLVYCAILIAYVHFSSQNSKTGASVKILVAFSQTVFHTINFPAWVRKQEQATVNFIFTIFTTMIALFNLEIPSLSNTASSGLNCPFDRPGYWYYSGQLLQHLITILVIALALLFALCCMTCGCIGKAATKKKSKATTTTPALEEQVSDLHNIAADDNKEDADKKQTIEGSDGSSSDIENPKKTRGNSSCDDDTDLRDLDANTQDLGADTTEGSIKEHRELTPDAFGEATFKDIDKKQIEQKKKSKALLRPIAAQIVRYTSPASFVRSLINMLIYTYQPIVDITFTFFFGCFTTGGGVSVFIDKSDLNCWTSGAYWAWSVFYLPVLAYIVLYPTLTVLFLRINKKNLENPHFKKYFGPLYDIYKPKYFWFEWVNFARRAALIGGGVIANSLILAYGVTGIQFVAYSVILSLNYVAVHLANPFQNNSDNVAEKYSLFVTLFMLSIQEGTSDISESVGVIFAMLVTTISLIVLILYVVREFWLMKKIISKCNCLTRRKKKGSDSDEDEENYDKMSRSDSMIDENAKDEQVAVEEMPRLFEYSQKRLSMARMSDDVDNDEDR